MSRPAWNSCTTFAAIGSALAYPLLISGFGLYWELIPGGLAGLIASYAVSTLIGAWFARIDIGRHLAHRIIAGVGAALITLLAATLAVTTTTFLVAMGIELAESPAGQPFWNAVAEFVPGNVADFIGNPTLAGLYFGQWPAVVLGIVFGATLRPTGPEAQTATALSSAPRYVASGSAILLTLLFASTTILMNDEQDPRTHVPVGVPVAIGGCGTAPVSGGVLGYCRGTPCVQGICEWGTEFDAIAVLVQGPANSQWRFTGGGMGNTTSPHIVGHRTRWVQPGPEGYFNEYNPTRQARYEFRFDGEIVRLRGSSFDFVPGMLLIITYADDWSYTVDVGQDALRDAGVTLAQLQEKLDEICAMNPLCDQSFQITE